MVTLWLEYDQEFADDFFFSEMLRSSGGRGMPKAKKN